MATGIMLPLCPTYSGGQIMDTPGVLSRPDEKRNEMEALTLASMQHLPTAVVFVMDLSGLSGSQSSLEKQVCKESIVVY